jgi:radical SAM protein with 4Fe4S-binding SPASM domain
MLDTLLEPQLVITTNCSQYSSECGRNCYFRAQRDAYGIREMPLEYFTKLMDIFEDYPIRQLVFIGGEPTSHSQLGNLLKISPYSLRLFSNGLFDQKRRELLLEHSPKFRPLFFHVTPFKKPRLFGNISALSSLNLGLRVNVDFPHWNTDFLKQICDTVPISIIGFSFSCPEVGINDLPQFKKFYLDFVSAFGEKRGIPIALGRPIPPCIFDSDDEKAYAEKYSSWKGTCTAINDLTINPDGTMQVCSVLHSTRTERRLENLDDFKEILEQLKIKESEIRSLPYSSEKCNSCPHKDISCQGGCLGYKNKKLN